MSTTKLEIATRSDDAADADGDLFDELVSEQTFCEEHQVTTGRPEAGASAAKALSTCA
jgi:hypothetical protein